MTTGRSRAWQIFLAFLVVGVWIPLLATLPMILGGMLWGRVGFETDLPLRHVVQAGLSALFVLVFLLLTGCSRMLVPVRPRRPAVFLLFVPLMFVNVVRGPIVEAGALFFLVAAVDALLVGFWEEFLFRGLIQDRLAVSGPRVSLFATAILFGLIHGNEGMPAVLIAVGIGLAFSVARSALGLWPLVLIHATIDFVVDIFTKRWEHQFTVGASLVALYFVASLVILVRGPRPTRSRT